MTNWRDDPTFRQAVFDACTPEQIAALDDDVDEQRIRQIARQEAERVVSRAFLYGVVAFLIGWWFWSGRA